MTLLLIAILIGALCFMAIVLFGAPYVPSLRKEVRQAFIELYPLRATDTVVDLGAGDGAVLVEAARYGAQCYAVELNPLLALIAKLRLGNSATVTVANMWLYKLPSDVTLVYVFSVSRDMAKLHAYMQREAERLQKPITLMTFGATLSDRDSVAYRNAHTLYKFSPLQAD